MDNQNGMELEHYGRLGMKWGMHIYGEDKTYRKSMTKLAKATRQNERDRNKALTYGYKSNEYNAKANMVANSRKRNRLYKKAYKTSRLSSNYIRSSNRNLRRANRIVKAMNKEFANRKISSFTDEDVMLGKKYCIDVLNRAMKDAKLYEED